MSNTERKPNLGYWNDKVEMKRQYNTGQENHENHVRSVLKVRQLNLNNQQWNCCNDSRSQ